MYIIRGNFIKENIIEVNTIIPADTYILPVEGEYFIKSIPTLEDRVGEPKLFANILNQNAWYEYTVNEKDKTDLEILQERLSALEKSNAELTTLIAAMATPTV